MYDVWLAGLRESVRCLMSNLEMSGGWPAVGRFSRRRRIAQSGLLIDRRSDPGVPCFVRFTGFTGAHGHSEREGHAGNELPTMKEPSTFDRRRSTARSVQARRLLFSF